MAYERRVKITASLQDAYKLYKQEYGDIDKSLYLNIIYDINRVISNKIIKESLEYRLPERLGFIRIRKKKQKLKIREGRIDLNKNVIDWNETWKIWQELYPNKTRQEIKKIKGKRVIFQTNDHTDGEIMSWYWEKGWGIKNISVYKFRPIKGGFKDNFYSGRLGLAKWIKSIDKNNDYYF